MPLRDPEKQRQYLRDYMKKRRADPDFCAQEKKRNRDRHRARRDWLQAIKADRGCDRCDENDPVCLDFHHLGGKVDCVSTMVADCRSKEAVLNEMAKCALLCANCHRKEHYKLRNK